MTLRLAHQMFGSHSRTKPPILILHGMFGSSNNWRSLGKKIAAETGAVVYALDARNHGSSDHVTQMDYHLMSRDTLKFCEEHRLERVSLLGHSMGGKTAMVIALTAPELVEKLVVVDVAPTRTPGTKETEDLVQALRSLDLSSLRNRREADALIRSRIPKSSTRDFLLMNLIHNPSNKQLMWRFNLDAIAGSMHVLKDFPKLTAKFSGKTSFIGGEKSDYITPENSVEIKMLFPNATIVHVSCAGHWLHVERPKEFLSAVTEVL